MYVPQKTSNLAEHCQSCRQCYVLMLVLQQVSSIPSRTVYVSWKSAAFLSKAICGMQDVDSCDHADKLQAELMILRAARAAGQTLQVCA